MHLTSSTCIYKNGQLVFENVRHIPENVQSLQGKRSKCILKKSTCIWKIKKKQKKIINKQKGKKQMKRPIQKTHKKRKKNCMEASKTGPNLSIEPTQNRSQALKWVRQRS